MEGLSMSKSVTSYGISILLIVSIALSGCMKQEESQLSMFRGNAQHTGAYPSNGPAEFHEVKWRYQAGGPIRSSPVMSNETLYFGSSDGNLYAVDANTGKQKWVYPAKGPNISSAAIAGDTAYFYSGDGHLYALRTADGSLLWSFRPEGKDKARDKVDYWQSSPVVDNGVVYFGAGNSMFYALEASSGNVRWKKKLTFNGYDCEHCSPILHSSPAVYQGVVYAGIEGYDIDRQIEPGNVVALDAKSGKQLWISALLSGAVDSSPVVDHNAVYFGMRNGGLQALNRDTGASLWESGTAAYVLASVALDRGTIYSGSSDDHKLLALNAANGEDKWSFGTIGPVHASPSTDGKTVYAACGNHYSDENQGIVYAVDADTGKERWSFKTGGNIYSSPMVDKGVLYIGSDDGYLYAID
ncbi:MAG: hypothetical protein JWR03_25 [Cohnella sp.]|nr:hypothetical protein [Cohnella sp.]